MNTQPFINQLLNHLVTDNPTVISITLDNKQRVCAINETGLRFFKRNQNAIVQAPFNTLFSNSETPDIQFTPDKNNTCQTTSNVVNNHLITWYCMFDNNQHQIIATIAPQNHHIENQFLQNIVNNVPHFIFWKNTDSIFLGCNKSFAEVAKLAQPNDIIGLSDFDMPWTEEQSHKYRDDDKAIIQSGNARLGYEETQTQADGSTKTLLVSKVPMRDLNDNTIGILGIYTDITQLKSIETNLAKAKRQAEQSDQAKSHFLAAVTHEFKTPLNGILGTLEVLRKAPLPNKERQLLYDIQEASRSLNTLVDDILDFSQIQSGSFHLKSTCFDLPKMIKTVFNQSQRRPKVSNINFKLELDPALPQYFLGDPTRIEQMINNLLSNAIKYTNQGEVKLIAQCIESTATSATISIEISDTGIGIEETQQEHIFDRFTQKYLNAVRWILNRKWVGLGALAVIIGLTVFLSKITPSGFIPTEDDNFLILSMKMPEGSSLHRTNVALRKADSILQQQPAVKGVNTVSGFNVVDNANSPSSGLAYVQLNPADDRGEIHEIQAVIKDLLSKLDEIPETDFNMYPRPTVQGFGNFDGVQFMLQDRADGDLGDFGQIVNEFMNTLNNQKEVENAFTSFNPNFPQYRLDIDYEKAKNMGVSVKDMMFTIQSYFGRVQPGDFNRFSRQYGVYMQSDIQFRESPESFNSIFVKNDEGEMVPVNTIVKLKQTYGPEVVNRYNLYNAAKINVTPAKGYSTGDVMNMIEDLTAKKLPATLSYEWTSMSLEEKNSGGDTIIVFIIIILLVYFILASQYESFLLPLAVMLSLPVGIFGVFTAINIAGIDNNIYVQIGIIMLIGLLAKNSILIVEFVAQKRRAGFTAFDAVIEASALRIRPIIMTSLAFTVGLVPLMFAEGSSAQGNHSVSIGTAGGMISGIVLGIFIIPVLAYVFQVLHDKMNLERYAE